VEYTRRPPPEAARLTGRPRETYALRGEPLRGDILPMGVFEVIPTPAGPVYRRRRRR
jgi:hypothetical protein